MGVEVKGCGSRCAIFLTGKLWWSDSLAAVGASAGLLGAVPLRRGVEMRLVVLP